MNQDVDISVIVPVYNGEPYLRACLDSALAQQDVRLEVICVDDGSTDGTASFLKARAAADSRVRVLRRAHEGSGAAKNAGLEQANGQYVAFLDADDLYPDDRVLADLLAAIRHSRCRLCGGNLGSFERDDPTAKGSFSFGPALAGLLGEVAYDSYQLPFGYTCFLYERAFLEEAGLRFPPLARYEDPVFFVRAMCAAKRFVSIDRCVYAYRIHHKEIDWSAEGGRLRRDHLSGLLDVARLAEREGFGRLMGIVLSDVTGIVRDVAAPSAVETALRAFFAQLAKCRSVKRPTWLDLFRAAVPRGWPLTSPRAWRLFGGGLMVRKLLLG